MMQAKMKLMINKLSIKNFKVFDAITIDFQSKSLNLLDGPNGFGKTTIYDAIELLFTGEIKRFSRLGDKIIDGRARYDEVPFYCNTGDGTPIMIKADVELFRDGKSEKRTILRKTKEKKDLLNEKSKHDFSHFKLYSAPSFESIESEQKVIDKPDEYLTELLGDNFKENFEFLNYVEQEESYYMLKHKDKDRKNSIQHLFNTDKYQVQIDKINSVKKHVKKLITNTKEEVERLSELVSESQFSSKSEDIQYKRLLTKDSVKWDKEEIDFKNFSYLELLGKDAVLPRIKEFISNKNDFIKDQKNKEIQNIIDKGTLTLRRFIKYFNVIDKLDDIIKERQVCNSILNFNQKVKVINSSQLTQGYYDLPSDILNIFQQNEKVKKYNQLLNVIKDQTNNSNKTEKLFIDLSKTRTGLINYFKEYLDEDNNNSDCPLCGYKWETQEVLLRQIESQTQELETISKSNSANLDLSITSFQENELNDLLELLNSYRNNSIYNSEFFEDINEFKSESISAIILYFEDNNIGYSDLVEIDFNLEGVDKNLDILISRLKEKIVTVNNSNLGVDFTELFTRYFEGDDKLLLKLTVEDVENKIKYIDWKYSLYQSANFQKYSTDLKLNEKQLKLLEEKEIQLNKLETTYKDSLKEYNAEVIKDIELLFHIYSGRILLDSQTGLGLFIKNDNDGLKFITNPSKTYDAVLSMSAGQLSALIISFTLALNKIYSRNKLLFIDDPVQTMDEINISGCVDLLRNEFSDRQIFISTHESMMSTFIRYKFEKFNLSTKRVNVKELVN
ncbi:AAA family ATPase [Flammeovirga aprica]|uniref:AAA family ATPase n=1 Tax=Flammeovirga aprica JL-4 TaxID=694437 RepID=A0A7X9NZD1_9BACT|nr:AAA family ATPase [Flammeovirga aprica]NME66580.1 AAA family ATPase [Flammeovirga aprica JL-4]